MKDVSEDSLKVFLFAQIRQGRHRSDPVPLLDFSCHFRTASRNGNGTLTCLTRMNTKSDRPPACQCKSDFCDHLKGRVCGGLFATKACSTVLLRRRCVISFLTLLLVLLVTVPAFAQGGPPYYTNDPGTPGNLDWEINFGYMPFLYSNNSLSHTPDVDINLGIGDRIQLTYEKAWLRAEDPIGGTRFGRGQSNPGVKWRFYNGSRRVLGC